MNPNHTSQSGNLPKYLRAAIESLSGEDLSDVVVHYSSHKPYTIQAHAYTQGTAIYLAHGQEHHLAHEAWHTVQQKQGRVEANSAVSGLPLNDNEALEREAEVMGGRAMQIALEMEGKNSRYTSPNQFR